MHRISRQSIEALEADAVRRWHERLMAWLREHAEPAQEMSDAELLALIERQEQRAATYGIETQRALAEWSILAVMKGERFDEVPHLRSFLLDPQHGSPAEAVDRLLRSHADWDEI